MRCVSVSGFTPLVVLLNDKQIASALTLANVEFRANPKRLEPRGEKQRATLLHT